MSEKRDGAWSEEERDGRCLRRIEMEGGLRWREMEGI